MEWEGPFEPDNGKRKDEKVEVKIPEWLLIGVYLFVLGFVLIFAVGLLIYGTANAFQAGNNILGIAGVAACTSLGVLGLVGLVMAFE